LRIAHVSDCYLPRLGGIEMQVHDLALRQSRWHDVSIFTSTAAPDGHGCGGVDVERVCGRARRPETIRYRSSPGGAAAVTAGGFDLVHVHASSFSPLSFLAARKASLSGVPVVATVHSLWAKATPLFGAADLLAGWGDWPVVWSAVSTAAAAPLRRVLGRRAEVAVLANGVDPEEWRVVREPPDGSGLRIAVVSRLAPRKRPFQLVQALGSARRRLPPDVGLHVEIVGEGPERPRVERYLRRHGMDGWVRLRGRVRRDEIRAVYARSDLFVAPAHLESFGIAALEARCAGLPILALAGTGVGDFVEHGREGWLVGSDRALVETIVSLATSPSLLERVAAHNRTTPPAVSWPAVLDNCESLYRAAASLHDRPWSSPPQRCSAGVPRVAS
jgi:glycosyltransferase involved in cell wall biosynthesis